MNRKIPATELAFVLIIIIHIVEVRRGAPMMALDSTSLLAVALDRVVSLMAI